VLAPDEADEGRARLTFSFDAWKMGNVAPTTIQLPVVKPGEEKKNAE
jgi:hypothetical protein